MKTITSTVKEVLEEAETVLRSFDVEEEDGSSHSSGSLSTIARGTGAATTNMDKKNASSVVQNTNQMKKPSRRSGWKKPADKPKRPLSAYNLFFSLSRERILNGEPPNDFHDLQVVVSELSKLRADSSRKKRRHRKTHGKISFTNLARLISKYWKDLPQESKIAFEKVAALEQGRYKLELKAWQQKKAKSSDASERSESTDDGAVEDKELDSSDRSIPQESTAWTTLPMEGAKLNSLADLMRQGRAYQHYQSILEQKRAEFQIRQSMLDHMQMMMSYTTDGLCNGSSHDMINYQNYGMVERAGYYDMADATLQMARRTLPQPPPPFMMPTPPDKFLPTPPTVLRLDPFVQSPIAPLVVPDQQPHPVITTTLSPHTPGGVENHTFIYDAETNSPLVSPEKYEPFSNSTITPAASSAMLTADLTFESMKLHLPEDGPIPFDFDYGLDLINESAHFEPICFTDDDFA